MQWSKETYTISRKLAQRLDTVLGDRYFIIAYGEEHNDDVIIDTHMMLTEELVKEEVCGDKA